MMLTEQKKVLNQGSFQIHFWKPVTEGYSTEGDPRAI